MMLIERLWWCAITVSTLGAVACKEPADNPASAIEQRPRVADSPGVETHDPAPRDAVTEPARLSDVGIFSDLNEQIALACPSWTREGPFLDFASSKTGHTWRAVGGVIICEGPPESKTQPLPFLLDSRQDHDGDGIPDAVDILRGAKKAAKNGAKYENHYRELEFPGGDVPRTEGVCTDVVIRALRNAGFDLQELVHDDIQARPGAYPMVQKRDPHIDHRRVRTILPYFEHAFARLPNDPRDSAFPYLPGDVVFMNTMGDSQPEHVGVVSDEVGDSGLPLIINNWTEGTVTRPMDLLRSVPVTHRFRASKQIELPDDQAGLAGVLARSGLSLSEDVRQAVLVTTPLWTSNGGTLRTYEKKEHGLELALGPIPVRIGSMGLGLGRGLGTGALDAPTVKEEGDKKAPAGVFRLGTAFGTRPKAPYVGRGWPYRATSQNDYWIDDPKSSDYNRWVTLAPGKVPRGSAERLSMYSLGLVVEHNTTETEAGAGSAIFLHPWRSPETSTVGCTALDSGKLVALLNWLDPKTSPVLIQLAGYVR